MSDTCGSKVIEFYQDSVVLITGASGFLGKVLLEKLLRCLEARKIYVLIRRKRDYSAQMRLEQILKSMVSGGANVDDDVGHARPRARGCG